MYKFERLRALLRMLSVAPPSRVRVVMRWLWVAVGYAAAILFALAAIFKTSHDWPVTWHDVTSLDEVARSFLLLCYMGLASGAYTVQSFSYLLRHSAARIAPPREIGPALRHAAQMRDARIVTVVEPAAPAQSDAAGGDSREPDTFTVAAPELLGRPLALALLMFAAGLLALAFASMFFWLGGFDLSPVSDGFISFDSYVFTQMRYISLFSVVAVLAFVAAGRLVVSWQARVRGARVTASAEGLTVRDHLTLWRPRFIPWRDVVSLVRFTYNDNLVRPRTVYLLDGGKQTFLWESPPNLRYVSPSIVARGAAQQASAARLLARVIEATGQPLLNITSVINDVAKIEPDPNNTSVPISKDLALLDFIEGVTSTKSPEIAPPTTAERWRKILVNVLAVIAVGYAWWAWYGGSLGH